MIKKILKRIFPAPVKGKIKRFFISHFAFLNVTRPYVIELQSRARFENKIAVVTGGSGALGRAICCRLAAEGAIVHVCGMTESKISSVVEEIKKMGGIAFGSKINVTDERSIAETFKTIIAKHSRIDILVTGAGGSAREKAKTVAEQDVEVIDSVLDVNLRGTILCTREAAKQMVKQQSGKIIALSSTIGCQGKAGYAEYSASKAGIIVFVKSLAMELGQYGVNVNCISPGIVQRDSIPPDQLKRLKKTNYMFSFGKPEDISNMVAYLASDEASFITGQNFIVDGGRSLGLKGD